MMDWLVATYVYEIKLGTSIVSLSTVYCKLDSLHVCILNYCVFTIHVYVFSVFVGDMIFCASIIYNLPRTVHTFLLKF